MSIGGKIRRLRLDAGLSGTEFGKLAGGLSKQQISGWESDTNLPPIDRLLELKKHIEFSFDWLFSADESSPPVIARNPRAQYFVQRLELDKPDSPRTSDLAELMDIAASMSERGLWELIGQARLLARLDPKIGQPRDTVRPLRIRGWRIPSPRTTPAIIVPLFKPPPEETEP